MRGFLSGLAALECCKTFLQLEQRGIPARSISISPAEPTIFGRRDNCANDEDVVVDLDADLQELSDIRQWVAHNSAQAPLSLPQIPMPQWLSTMSSVDGVPNWLATIQPSQGVENEQVVYASGVRGALIELEKWVPTASLSMVQLFFPVGLKYEDQNIRDNVHKKFWQKAYHTTSIRLKAGKKRRAEEKSW